MQRSRKAVLTLLGVATIFASLQGCSNNLPSSTATAIVTPATIQLFVSPNGNDLATGSFDQPFQTLTRARDEIRSLNRVRKEPITVNLREGSYYFDQTLLLNTEDSGTAESPITWQAFNGETVWLTGGMSLPHEAFSPLEDAELLSRVDDAAIKANLLTIDLSGYLEEWPLPTLEQGAFGIRADVPEVYVGEKALDLARWPNDTQNNGYLFADMAEKTLWEGMPSVRLASSALQERAEKWAASATDELGIFAMMEADWLSGMYEAASLNHKTGELITQGRLMNEPMPHPRFYIFNLLEELDMPGEFTVNREKRSLILYPPDGFKDDNIILSVLKEPLLRLDGVEHVTFRGLSLGYVRHTPFYATNVEHITIDDCVMAHSAYQGIILNDATNCVIQNSQIHDSAGGGIYLWDGGLRKDLVNSGNVIEYNRIHNTNRKRNFYNVALDIQSTGVVLRGNEIFDEAHIAIDLTNSNDALVQFNEIHHVCLDSSDSGAIYIGRDPSDLGIIIQNNYFHDIGNTYGGVGQQAIFLDDGTSMPIIRSNLFVKACSNLPRSAAINANGGQFGVIEQNIFVDLPYAATLGSWSVDPNRTPMREDGWIFSTYGLGFDWSPQIWKKLTEDVDFFGKTWREHYRDTQWAPLWDYLSPKDHLTFLHLSRGVDAGEIPDAVQYHTLYEWAYDHAPSLTNLLRDNVSVQLTAEDFWWGYNGRVTNNPIMDSGIFENYSLGDFRLSEQGLERIRLLIPGFPEIPLECMGLKAKQCLNLDADLPNE